MKNNPGWILAIAALANFGLGVWNLLMFEWHTVIAGVANLVATAVCSVTFYRNIIDTREHNQFLSKIKRQTDELNRALNDRDSEQGAHNPNSGNERLS